MGLIPAPAGDDYIDAGVSEEPLWVEFSLDGYESLRQMFNEEEEPIGWSPYNPEVVE